MDDSSEPSGESDDGHPAGQETHVTKDGAADGATATATAATTAQTPQLNSQSAEQSAPQQAQREAGETGSSAESQTAPPDDETDTSTGQSTDAAADDTQGTGESAASDTPTTFDLSAATTADGTPSAPIGQSTFAGPPGGYDQTHIDETVQIDSVVAMLDAIDIWTRCSVIAMGVHIQTSLDESRAPTIDAALEALLRVAAELDVAYDDATPLRRRHIDVAERRAFDTPANEVIADSLAASVDEQTDVLAEPAAQGATTGTGDESDTESDEQSMTEAATETTAESPTTAGAERPVANGATASGDAPSGSGQASDTADDNPQRQGEHSADTTAATERAGAGTHSSPTETTRAQTSQPPTPTAPATDAAAFVDSPRSVETSYEPTQIVSPVDMGRSEIQRAPVSEPALDFLSTVVDVMNGATSLPRYASLKPLRALMERRGADIDALVAEDYLTPHSLCYNIETYTVTPAGRLLIGTELSAAPGVGDIGGGMPHRALADLVCEWLAANDAVTDTRAFVPANDDGDRFDVVAKTRPHDAHDPLAHTVVEVEAGMSSAERAATGGDTRVGTLDYGSIAKDYDMMASLAESDLSVDGGCNAIWVTRTHEQVNPLIRALCARDRLSFEFDEFQADVNLQGGENVASVNRYLAAHADPGCARIFTARQLWSSLSPE